MRRNNYFALPFIIFGLVWALGGIYTPDKAPEKKSTAENFDFGQNLSHDSHHEILIEPNTFSSSTPSRVYPEVSKKNTLSGIVPKLVWPKVKIRIQEAVYHSTAQGYLRNIIFPFHSFW